MQTKTICSRDEEHVACDADVGNAQRQQREPHRLLRPPTPVVRCRIYAVPPTVHTAPPAHHATVTMAVIAIVCSCLLLYNDGLQ